MAEAVVRLLVSELPRKKNQRRAQSRDGVGIIRFLRLRTVSMLTPQITSTRGRTYACVCNGGGKRKSIPTIVEREAGRVVLITSEGRQYDQNLCNVWEHARVSH